MLENENIPFEFMDRSIKEITIRYISFQICYPCYNSKNQKIDGGGDFICSVIQSGAKADRLEIMGLLTSEEEELDCVVGGLTAEEVFSRIKNHFKGTKDE